MKKVQRICSILMLLPALCFSQPRGKKDVFQKATNTMNKVNTIIAVFQPYLLKARELFYDAKQLGTNVKNSSKALLGRKGKNDPNGSTSNGTDTSQYMYANSNTNNQQGNSSNANNGNSGYQQGNGNNSGNYQNNSGNQNTGNNTPQNYLPNQSLPINNPATINNDGTGNWGNQNNGLYGNCLDALTGTVMGMGEAADKPSSVDLLFFAPADGQNTYYLMTPSFAKNNSTATYMTEHTSDAVLQWTDVNETEVAITKLSIGQFNQIQNNGQISNAVRNAQQYSGYYAGVGQKLDGQVFAVKAQMENRQVYALIAVIRQIGTSGSNGYLKIQVKAMGIDSNGTGQVNANAYVRQ